MQATTALSVSCHGSTALRKEWPAYHNVEPLILGGGGLGSIQNESILLISILEPRTRAKYSYFGMTSGQHSLEQS
jgi:hypothetical protein